MIRVPTEMSEVTKSRLIYLKVSLKFTSPGSNIDEAEQTGWVGWKIYAVRSSTRVVYFYVEGVVNGVVQTTKLYRNSPIFIEERDATAGLDENGHFFVERRGKRTFFRSELVATVDYEPFQAPSGASA